MLSGLDMSLTFATFNTNSIRARLPIILDWLERERPDVLCVQETKAQDKDFPGNAFESVGYQAVFKGQKSYNGVAIISGHSLEKVFKNLYDGDDEEARFISARGNRNWGMWTRSATTQEDPLMMASKLGSERSAA